MPTPAFVEHCIELLAPLGPVRAGRMFSGHGFYVDGVFMALSIGDRLYLKTADADRDRLAAAGSEPFAYEGHRGTVTTSYWAAPAEAMDSPALMLPWARAALQAALSARAAKAPRKRGTARAAAGKPAAGDKGGTRGSTEGATKGAGKAIKRAAAAASPPARKPAPRKAAAPKAAPPRARRGG